MILQREISKLANRLYREALATYGKKQAFRIPETTIERDYCLAWLLSALSKHEALATALAFKGGTALRRVHFGEYRFSEDLDFTLVTEIPLEQIFSELDVLFDVLAEASGIRFSRKSGDPVRHARNDTFYLEYQGPLPSKGSVKVDVTRGETLVFELERKPVLQTYPEFSDLPDDRRILVYSFPEVAVEKTLAVTDNARREPRDLYDLWYLAEKGVLPTAQEMVDPLSRKLGTREGRAGDVLVPRLDRVEKELGVKWKTRLEYQVANLPPFDGCFRAVRRLLAEFDGLRERRLV